MCFYLRNWQVTFLLYTLGVFLSEYIAKAPIEPRDYRVVFLIQKMAPGLTARHHLIFRLSIYFYQLFLSPAQSPERFLKIEPSSLWQPEYPQWAPRKRPPLRIPAWEAKAVRKSKSASGRLSRTAPALHDREPSSRPPADTVSPGAQSWL